MIARMLGMGMCFFSCIAIGRCSGRKLQERSEYLQELERVIQILKGEIEYASLPLQDAFVETALHIQKEFGECFRKIAGKMELYDGKTLKEIFEECAEEQLTGTALCDTDILEFCAMGGRLGFLDKQMQIQLLEQYRQEVVRKRKTVQKEYEQKEKVYHCLGFAAGFFLVLLLL